MDQPNWWHSLWKLARSERAVIEPTGSVYEVVLLYADNSRATWHWCISGYWYLLKERNSC